MGIVTSTKRALTWTRLRARAAVLAIGRRLPFVLTGARSLVIAARGIRYRVTCSRNPIERHVVVFQAYGARGYSCSPRALYLAMLADERFSGYEYVWALRADTVRALQDLGGYDTRGLQDAERSALSAQDLVTRIGERALEELKHATIVPYATAEYYRSLARAEYSIANCIIPDHVKPRDGQTFLQAWHGTPLKRLGCDIPHVSNPTYTTRGVHTRYRREGARSTYLLAASEFAAEKFASAFDLTASGRQDIILVEGYPRNDFLVNASDQEVAAIRRRLGLPRDKKVVLYAPTWRDQDHDPKRGFVHQLDMDFDALSEKLGDEYVVLFRAHYLIARDFDFSRYAGFVRDVSAIDDINDLYLVSDVLITDYSSVFFDYANLKRPIIFYMYDLERYAEDIRGFYVNLDELPGPIVRTEQELIAALEESAHPSAALGERYQRFNERFNYLDDGSASKRVLDRIMRVGD